MSRKGPFGLWKSMALQDFAARPQEMRPGLYQTNVVPKAHSAFDSYVLRITPKCGLSWIKAVGKTIATSAYGVELRSAFDALEAKLTAIYGKGNLTDVLFPDSIWNEPRDWTTSMLQRERILMKEWSRAQGSNVGDSLASVALVVCVIDDSSGFIAVEYAFDNDQEAESEIAALEDDAL